LLIDAAKNAAKNMMEDMMSRGPLSSGIVIVVVSGE